MTWPFKVAVATLALALPSLTASPSMAADPRAQDAVDLFIDACVTDVLGLPPRVTDPARFSSRKVSEAFFADVGIEGRQRTGAVYEFTARGSRARLQTTKMRGGACVVAVSMADDADIRAAFQGAVERAAADGRATLALPTAEARGPNAGTARTWLLHSPKAKLVLSIEASLPKFGIQHLLTSIPAN